MKSAIASFARGLTLPLTAARLLVRDPKLKRVALLPLVVNLIVYIAVVWLGVVLLAHWKPHVGPWAFGWGFGTWLADSLNVAFGLMKWAIALPLLLLFCYFTFTSVGLVVASPFNDVLSDRVERTVCQPKPVASLSRRQAAASTLLSLVDSLTIAVKQSVISLLVLPLVWVPAIGLVPLVLVGAYYTGLGVVDIAMARNHLRGRHKNALVTDRRWEILGLGMALHLLFFVPLVGLLVLPVGVTAGTLLYCRYDWLGGLARRNLEPPQGFASPCWAHRRRGWAAVEMSSRIGQPP